MKYVKMLGLAAVAAMALMAFVGAGSASATVLCSTNTSPCPAGQKWPTGTQIEFTVTSGTSANWEETAGNVLETCTSGKIKGEITNAGSSTEAVKIKATEVSWTSCNVPTTTTGLGSLEIQNISGTSNGTLTMGSGFKFTQNTVLFGSCVYGSGTGIDMGTLTGGAAGSVGIDVNTVLGGGEGVCCPSAKWSEHFTLTGPSGTALYVKPS
jgi:hypothetical protein